MNPIWNPGFESESGIQFGGVPGYRGERRNDLGTHSGDWAGYLPASVYYDDTFGIWVNPYSWVRWYTIPVVDGKMYTLGLWVDGTHATHAPGQYSELYAELDPGNGVFGAAVTLNPVVGWHLWQPCAFKAEGVWAQLRVGARITNADEEAQWTYWLVDDASMTLSIEEVLEDDMAVMLSERPRKALLATLQERFNDMLSYIDVERSDGLQLQPVTAWYGFRRPDSAGPELTEVQVFRPGRVAFGGWRRDVNTQLSVGSCVLGSEHEFVVRVHFANRYGYTTGQMRDIADRYEAALARVFRDAPQIGQGDVALLDEPSIDTDLPDGSDGRSWGRTVARVTVSLQEDATNEGVAGGAIAPAAVTESTR